MDVGQEMPPAQLQITVNVQTLKFMHCLKSFFSFNLRSFWLWCRYFISTFEMQTGADLGFSKMEVVAGASRGGGGKPSRG